MEAKLIINASGVKKAWAYKQGEVNEQRIINQEGEARPIQGQMFQS
jgi:hypothetical protein